MIGTDTYYFLIPYSEVQQKHISLSVSPEATKSSLPSRVISGVTFLILETDRASRRHDAYVNYRSYANSDELESATPGQTLGANADFRGVLAVTTSESPTTSDYTVPSDRFIRRIWIESRDGVIGDTLTVQIRLNGATVRTPVSSWNVQLGLMPIDLPDVLTPAGIVFRFIYTYSSSSSSARNYTVNFQQYIPT